MAAVFLVGMLAGCGRGERPSHVVLISIDSLRADHLGCYGYELPTSPVIDQLAAEGTLFERAVSSTSWTLPAHAALFTGLADSLHGVVAPKLALGPGAATLAERLREAGFATGAVVSGPLLLPGFGLDRGFDEYLNCMGYLDESFSSPEGEPVDMRQMHAASHRDVTGPCVSSRAGEWLARHREGKAFLFLHFWDVHYDYRPPEALVRRFDPDYAGSLDPSGFARNPAINPEMPPRDLQHLIALYDAEIAYTDGHVARVLGHLGRLGLFDRTLVILLSDHGDAFFEHGRKGHKKDLHAEVVRIPLIVRGPGVAAGRRLPGPAHLTDVFPTVLELLGLEVPPPGPGRGVSLAAALTGSPPPAGATGDRWVASELEAGPLSQLALESLEWKLILDRRGGAARAYDLRRDPGELEPLEPPPEAFERARREAAALARGRGEHSAVPVGALAPEALKDLEALGYLD